MKIDIFTRQFIVVAIAVFGAIIGVSIFAIRTSFTTFSEQTKTELLREAGLFESMLSDSIKESQLDTLAKNLGNRIGSRFTVIALDGRVLADTEKDPSDMENHADRPEFIQALENGSGSSIRHSATLNQYMVYSGIVSRNSDDSLRFVVRASMPLETISKMNSAFARRIVFLGIVLLIFALLTAYISKRFVIRRIDKLTGVAEEIAKGNFETRVEVSKGEEFEALQLSLNKMAENLEGLFDKISRRKENLYNILESLNEGVLVIDEKGKIILMNKNAEKPLRLYSNDVEGKDALGTLIIPETRQLIENPEKRQIEFSENERRYEAEISNIGSSGRKIIAIRDITEHYRIQKTKTDFVSNVSHELRTPLTLIKGFAETLDMESLQQEQEKYVKTILRHTNRLISLVEDLMTLSKVELDTRFVKEPVNLVELIDEILPLFQNRASDKEINITISNDVNLPSVLGDRNLLEIAISNLIDNAIKYNKPNGEVTIALKSDEQNILITVSDTGIGIPKDELDRIFERFYTVDKARSHSVGGTGLGLSIVKHIILLHDGEVDVKSVLDEGSTFTVKLSAVG